MTVLFLFTYRKICLMGVFKLPALHMLSWEEKGLWEAEEHLRIICLIWKTVYTGNTVPTPYPYLRTLLRWSVRRKKDKFSSLSCSICLSWEVKFRKVLPYKDLQEILDRHSLSTCTTWANSGFTSLREACSTARWSIHFRSRCLRVFLWSLNPAICKYRQQRCKEPALCSTLFKIRLKNWHSMKVPSRDRFTINSIACL